MPRPVPEWFSLGEEANPQVMRRIADAVSSDGLPFHVQAAATMAHWFVLDSMLLANQANRDGMHANALALLRSGVEAISVIELTISKHPDAESVLAKWNEDRISAGKLRGWLQENVWPGYGTGLWDEPWSAFMREFAGAVQPYAHYGRSLAQWQFGETRFMETLEDPTAPITGLMEMRPRAYDPQKATRITLFNALLVYVLGRVWISAAGHDTPFAELMKHFGSALGKSRYLDGHQTDWSQQFWAMVWERGGNTILE